MAEFHAPSPARPGGTAVLLCVFVLVAGMFLTVRGRISGSVVGLNRRLPAMVLTPSKPKEHAATHSMNGVEYQLFRVLALVQSGITSRWSGKWGWAIILLTVAINVLLLPLRIHSMRSSLKMQRIQPEMEAIRVRYRGVALTDPRRSEMNAEIAQLQKNNGIDAFGGCLPLLLQLPLLFAFFGMLRHADVLRGAGWLWLHDLSAPDPYHVLPLSMLVSQLLVQWYTPSPGVDPKQRRMMALVTTIAFGYVSWHYASGLALYAVTGSVMSLLLQLAANSMSASA